MMTTKVHADHPNPQRLSPHSFHDNTVNTLLLKDDDVAAALAQSQRTRAARPILQSPRSMLLCFILRAEIAQTRLGME